jgi:predicted nuclease of predicted toxin-antitoxin system
VRFLLDENLSPLVCGPLIASGHEAVHVRDLGLSGAPDRVVLERADQDGRVVISSDTDFGQLLARSGASAPSVIMFRREEHRRAAAQASLILANLEQVQADLEAGAIVVLQATRVRVRRLPVRPRGE